MLICEALAFFLSFFFFFQKLLTLRKWNLWFRGPSSEGVERDRKKKTTHQKPTQLKHHRSLKGG